MSDNKSLSLIGKMGGKKMITALTSVVGVILTTQLGLTEEQASNVIQAIMLISGVFMAGQTVVDAATGGATSSATTTVDPAEMARIKLSMQMEKAREAQHLAEIRKAEAQKIAMELIQPATPAAEVLTEDQIAAQQR